MLGTVQVKCLGKFDLIGDPAEHFCIIDLAELDHLLERACLVDDDIGVRSWTVIDTAVWPA